MKKYEKGIFLICIKNNCCEKELTINNIYILVDDDPFYIDIVNDLNVYKNYSCNYFITLKEYEILHRKDKINKCLKF